MNRSVVAVGSFVVAVLLVATLPWVYRSQGHVLAQEAAKSEPVPSGKKIPDDIGVRIRNVQLDQSHLQTQLLQLAQQYQADQQAIQHDNDELNSLKAEALKSASLDPATNDVDVERLQFITKPGPPKPEAKK